jgi:ABC-type nitrate/sulfonate/bicarbonate transport system substrate-binding protein
MRRRDVLGLTLAAIAAAPCAARAQTPVVIRVGTPPFEAAAEVYFAKEQGYFSRAGLDVQIVPIVNSSAIAEAVASASVDIGFSAVLSIAIAHARGIPFVMIAPGNVHDPAAQIAALIVPVASPVRVAKDLTGKTVGIPALKTIGEYAPRIWIDRNGGDSMSVKFLELPFPAMADALGAGRIDAAWVTEPFISSNKRTTRVLAYAFDTIAKSFLISGWFATSTWARAHADVVSRFSSAIRASGAWATQNPAASAAVLTSDMKLDPATLAAMVRTRFADQLSPAAIQPQIDVAARYGLFTTFPANDLLLSPAR